MHSHLLPSFLPFSIPVHKSISLSLTFSPVVVFRSSALFALVAAFLFYGALTSSACPPRSVKQKAWIITLLSSTLTTLGSVPFLVAFLTASFSLTPTPSSQGLSYLAHALCGAFQGFLVADLLIGAAAYPSEVSLLTGWTHHAVYALLLPYVAARGWAHIFALCLAMEAPTTHLSAARLWPSVFRNDIVHAAVFFVFRIVLHVRLIQLALQSSVRNRIFSGSWLPFGLLCAAFALHAWWFVCAVTGIRRRSAQAIAAKTAPATTTEEKSPATTIAATSAMTTTANVTARLAPAFHAIRPTMGLRRRNSISEFLIVKGRSARAHARKRAPWILALPAAYTLMKLAIRYAPLPSALDAEF